MRRTGGLEPERRAGASLDAGEDDRGFVELAKSKRGQLNSAIPAPAPRIDLSAQKLFQVADIKLANVGYKGQPQALIDLMTNLMHFEIVSLAGALPHIKEGTVKPLAVFTDKRVPDLPDVPTIAETVSPPRPMCRGTASMCRHQRLTRWSGRHDAIDKALENPAVQKQLSISDIPGKPMPLKDLSALMRADYEKLNKVVTTAGMALQ